MKKHSVTLVFVFALTLFSSEVLAFGVTSPSNTFSVPLLGSKQIDITLTGDTSETVTITPIDSRSWITVSDTQATLSPGQQKTVSVFVSPSADTLLGLYKISILFESLATSALRKADIFVSIEKGSIISIDSIKVTGELVPLGSADIEVRIKNLKTVTVTNMEVTVRTSSPFSSGPAFVQVVPRLDPGQETIVRTNVAFDKLTPPSTYTIDASAKFLDETYESEQTFYVGSKAVIETKEESGPTFFGYHREIRVTNYGNAAGTETVTRQLSGIEYVFMVGDKPDLRSGDSVSWNLDDVVPGETRIIRYSVDYSPVFIFIIALVILAWLFVFKYRTMHVRKYIIQEKKLEEGEEFTVALEIHNNTGQKMDVDVADFVPSVFNVKEYVGPKPQKKKTQAGVELSWSLKGLSNRETRIMNYRISPVFGISGRIKLPKACASFRFRNRQWESRSLHASVGVHPEDEPEPKFLKKHK